ncbi:glycosyltransferase family 2 protein [Thermosulfurimonas sp. F29]|uniref:glycosyltransferase n=1 Tax=Thermosulfurimonas sp. F29 TaxID=2867247 RepID=UPI001C835D0D|nr:glycosyltransferase family 2 protein [Thermosulfurimonas sp. F29]MBX6424248.1 glycosyltransferase family 2 protein [Thermosulfurimonas sp. F29]
MVRPRGILFALKEDLSRLTGLLRGERFFVYKQIWESPREVPLSGPENEVLADLVRDVGAWAVFLPHPESPPPRRRITRAVLRALTGRAPREMRLFFYNVDERTALPYDWDGSPQEFFPLLPLVSVVVRTDGSPLVREALASLRSQTYDRFEVLIVSHGKGFEPEARDRRDFELRLIPGEEDRGRNLNLGVEAASGRYLAFLDQDDLWRPDHLEKLVAALQSRPDYAVAYTGTVVSRWERRDSGSQFLGVLRVYREAFDPLRLFFENYLPLNSLLFRRELFLLERFPEGIPAYEDWVFLVRLVLRGLKFLPLHDLTAEYRVFGEDLLSVHREKGFLEAEPEAVRLFLEALSPEAYFLLKKAYLESRRRTEEATSGESEAAEVTPPSAKSPAPRCVTGDRRCAVVVAARDTPEDLLERLFASLSTGDGGLFTLYVLENGGVTGTVRRVVRKWRRCSGWRGRLRYLRRWGSSISEAYNFLAGLSTEPYVFPVDHDDELVPGGVARLLEEAGPGVRLIYADSEIIDRAGRTLLVQSKPDWSPDTLFSFNYINHPLVIRRDLWENLGGFREEFDGAQDWDLLLRAAELLKEAEVVHVREVLYRWRAHPGSLALRPGEKPWAVEAARRCLEAALRRRLRKAGYGAFRVKVGPNPEGTGFRKIWSREGNDCPSVRVIVLTPGNVFRVRQLLKALEKEGYPRLAVTVVSNGAKSLRGLDLARPHRPHVEVINLGNEPFNWSRFNNLAAGKAREDFLLFLNDDLAPEPNLLSALVGTAILTGAGAVGAALFFPDASLQHNGIVTHPRWIAREIREKGVRGELALTRNVSAVTGAVLLTPREVFRDIGGFDERLPLNFNDVDYCLRLRKSGRRVVLAWEAQAVHFCMTSRGKTSVSPEEKRAFASRREELEDPYFYRWKTAGGFVHLTVDRG